jgi:hypothetical protein
MYVSLRWRVVRAFSQCQQLSEYSDHVQTLNQCSAPIPPGDRKTTTGTRLRWVALAVNAKISRGKTSADILNLTMLHPVKVRHWEA